MKCLGTEVLYSNGSILLIKDKVESNSGVRDHVYIKKQNAVLVIAVHEQNIVFVRQERHIVGGSSLELPGGRIEKDENPSEAAERELKEETGLRSPESTKLIGEFFPLLSVTNEKVYVYLMDGLKEGIQNLDETESSLTVQFVPVNKLRKICATDVISGPDMLVIHMYLSLDSDIKKKES